VLDYDGEILVESMDIVRALDERHPEPPLYPPERRPEVDAFIDWFNGTWKGPPNEIEAELSKPEPDEQRIAALEAEMIASLDRFESMLQESDYFFGDRLTAADICAFPFLKFATLHDREDDELFHIILRDRQRDGTKRPGLAAWIQRMNALERA
jgi:glutathione S-transferase